MKDERLLEEEQDLADAFRSVRDRYDGTSADASVTLQRALFRTRKHASRQRFARWGLIPIAAVLAASTAWAGVTGRLAPALHSVLETLHIEHPRPVEAPAPIAAREATPATAPPAVMPAPPDPAPAEVVPPPAEVVPPPAEVVPPPAEVVPPPPVTASVVREPLAKRSADVAPLAEAREAAGKPPAAEPVPAPTASAPDPHAPLFAEAHRIHFVERDPARALDAWDRYLAVAPAGRFAPEARYNRALSLVRLGRPAEAKPELEAFARGAYGSYRREEAKALLDALGR